MKKTLSVLAVLGMVAVIGTQAANAFEWSDLNPAYWGNRHCSKCERQKSDCGCKKVKKCDPCEKVAEPCPCPTGAAAPCDPCMKKSSPCNIPAQQPCEPCNRLQNMQR